VPEPLKPERSGASRRVTLVLSKPIGWFPKPTVVVGGRGHPAQWGEGTWQVDADGASELRVFLFNRVWRFGEASITIDPNTPDALTYRAPFLPFLRGRLGASGTRTERGVS
jgi:hypothetical protein